VPPAVLHHAALPHRGGAVRVARLLAQAQLSAGRDARLCFEVAENDPEALADTLANVPDGATAIPLLGPTPPENLAAALETLPADALLHLHTSTDWPALLAALPDALRGRVLVTLHDATAITGGCAYPLDCPHQPVCAQACPRGFPDARARQSATAAHLARLEARIVSPSGWLAGLARSALPGQRIRVVPNGIPWPESLPERARARALLGLEPNAPTALFAAHGGARAAYKSGADWPQYWEALGGGLPGARAFAAGGDEAYSRRGLTVWPYVDRAKLALVMRAADVLVYPALADNHPLVLMEAASLELPAASYAVGGVPEIVRHGETGLLAAPGDREGFLAAARALLTDASLRRRMGRAARDSAGRRFRAERMARDYEALYAVPNSAQSNSL
jgi:glycosyltransferase involved in cell wall biosynthesis